MRHFLHLTSPLALPVAPLAIGVPSASLAALLVLAPGSAQRLSARLLSAPIGTVDVASVTATADHHLPAAASAVEHPVNLPDGSSWPSSFWTKAIALAILPLREIAAPPLR
jgi:hypothetical protein